MNNRWTIKELEECDDLTFAMCILSERRGKLNQEAPLAKKLKRAYRTLERLRDICHKDTLYNQDVGDEKYSIYRGVSREFCAEDIKERLGLDPDNPRDCWLNLKGIDPAEILSNDSFMDRIVDKVEASEGDEYYFVLGSAIETVIKEAVEAGEIEPGDED